MSWQEERLSDWSHFTTLMDRFLSVGVPWERQYLFRGQSNASWNNLKPSIARLLGNESLARVRLAEQESLSMFKRQAHNFINMNTFDDLKDPLEWWPIMQHYRSPTRLLDWTASGYVAAYFAARDHWNHDGVIWCFHANSLRNLMAERYPGMGGDNVNSCFKLSHDQLFGKNTSSYIMAIKNEYDDNRMYAQQGEFTVCLNPLADHAKLLTEALHNDHKLRLVKWIIPKDQKPGFLRRLLNMNMGANTLFPGIDGLGQSIEELMRLQTAPPIRDPYEFVARANDPVPPWRVTMVYGGDLISDVDPVEQVQVRFSDPLDRPPLGDDPDPHAAIQIQCVLGVVPIEDSSTTEGHSEAQPKYRKPKKLPGTKPATGNPSTSDTTPLQPKRPSRRRRGSGLPDPPPS